MPNYAALTWDGSGTRFYENGVSKGVLYMQDSSGAYPKGVAWNGLTGVDSNPDGAELTELWADNMKYAAFRSAEKYGGTIKAYTYPDEFSEADGYVSPSTLGGMRIGQQKRKPFGVCYRTEESNDLGVEGYVLHLVYGCTVSPSDQGFATINDNPDAVEFSWDFDSTPVTVTTAVANAKPTSYVELRSIELGSTKMTAIETVLYGSSSADARLPLPDEVASILAAAT